MVDKNCASGWSGYPAGPWRDSVFAEGRGVAAEDAVPGDEDEIPDEHERGRRPMELRHETLNTANGLVKCIVRDGFRAREKFRNACTIAADRVV